MEGESFSIN